jgi:hypothetical protein
LDKCYLTIVGNSSCPPRSVSLLFSTPLFQATNPFRQQFLHCLIHHFDGGFRIPLAPGQANGLLKKRVQSVNYLAMICLPT